MRVAISSTFLALLMLLCGTVASAEMNIFTQNLSLGSTGAQVLALQKILNRDSDTLIANIGPGSPGNETSYFGSLTRMAVIRFQEKYATDVLTPVGLSQGNGYVRLYTRAKLNALFPLTTDAPTSVAAPEQSVSTVQPAPPSTANAKANPNMKNIDIMLATIDTVATKQGYSASDIAVMKKQITENLATTTDLRAEFEKVIQSQSTQATLSESIVDKALALLWRAFDEVVMPQHARASSGTPFGGAVVGLTYCNVGYNIFIRPLPPTFVSLLYYAPGSQAFLSYNIPATSWLLGKYAGSGSCWIGHVYIPSEGAITPMVGSSPS